MVKFIFQLFALATISLTLMACSNDETEIQQKSAGEDSANNVSPNSPIEPSASLIQFPEKYEEGVLYTTVTRGNAFEELYTSKETIEAVQNGEAIPNGTVITLKIYENEELNRIFVMEKRNDWDPDYLSEQRNGEWAYQSFTPEGTVNEKENVGRCISCHAGQEGDDFLYKLDEMKEYDLEEIASMQDTNTASSFTDIHTEDWGIIEVDANIGVSQTRVVQDGENVFLEDTESKEIVQNVLLTMYFNELKNK